MIRTSSVLRKHSIPFITPWPMAKRIQNQSTFSSKAFMSHHHRCSFDRCIAQAYMSSSSSSVKIRNVECSRSTSSSLLDSWRGDVAEYRGDIGASAGEVSEYCGEVGEYCGEADEYCGEVGEYCGDLVCHPGEVGEYSGEVGEY